MNIVKTVRSEIRKWMLFDSSLFVKKDIIKLEYRNISLGNYKDKKKAFINLHYLKMYLDYNYLKIYYNNIKKNLYNEKLLNYFESILVANGFDISR